MANYGICKEIVRVCDPSEYEGTIYIECYYSYCGKQDWMVPAWDEWGLPELSPPFNSVEDAQRTIDEFFERFADADGIIESGAIRC